MRELERRVILSVLDRRWREHLYEMDYLQEGIGLRAMAQRDPLVEYQREGFDLFRAMMDSIQHESVGYLFNVEVELDTTSDDDATDIDGEHEDGHHNHDHPTVTAPGLAPARPANLSYSAPTVDGAAEVTRSASRSGDSEFGDVARNAPCPCGSGKKFKRCHGDPRNRNAD
jgi:preprotein translocase subunit SecA